MKTIKLIDLDDQEIILNSVPEFYKGRRVVKLIDTDTEVLLFLGAEKGPEYPPKIKKLNKNPTNDEVSEKLNELIGYFNDRKRYWT